MKIKNNLVSTYYQIILIFIIFKYSWKLATYQNTLEAVMLKLHVEQETKEEYTDAEFAMVMITTWSPLFNKISMKLESL